MLTSATWLGIAVLSLSGCGRPPRQARHTLLPSAGGLSARAAGHVVTEKPDAQAEVTLVRSGASPALIEALRVDANVLTASQKKPTTNWPRNAWPQLNGNVGGSKSSCEREQAKAKCCDHTLKNMRHAEACKAQKESLETRIASQEAQISRLRKNGYTDGQLVEYNDKLNRYRQELHNLKQPMP